MKSSFAASREGLEQRLAAAEGAAEKVAAVEFAEARGREAAEKTATAIVAAAQRKVAELVGTAATREGEASVHVFQDFLEVWGEWGALCTSGSVILAPVQSHAFIL